DSNRVDPAGSRRGAEKCHFAPGPCAGSLDECHYGQGSRRGIDRLVQENFHFGRCKGVTGLKIAVIGGGSSYTPELVEGFLKRYEELAVSELWLVDIPEGEEKLRIVGALAERMVEKAGVP